MSGRRGFLDEPAALTPPPAQQEAPAVGPGARGWIDGSEIRPGPVRHEEPPLEVFDVTESSTGSAKALTCSILGLLVVAIFASLGNSLILAFQQAPAWGAALALVVALLLGALTWAIWREWRGYIALGLVESVRWEFKNNDRAVVQAVALSWLRAIQRPDLTEQVIGKATDADTVRALLRGGPIKDLEDRTAQIGRAYGIRVLAATAVCPWPGLDGLIVVWQSLRMVRQIATLHGLRPGTVGSAALLRRAAMDSGTVVATDLAVTAVVDGLLSSQWIGGLAGQAAGSAVAARRIVRLALVTGAYCRPL